MIAILLINTSFTGLLPNTTYTCCVLAVTSYGESEQPVCQNILMMKVIFMGTMFIIRFSI